MEATGKRYIYHSSRSDVFKLWNLSDIHWLAKSCAEKEVHKDIQTIFDDPFSFWISTGDLADFIGYDDGKRFDPDCVSERVKVSDFANFGDFTIKELESLLEPIKRKCLGIGLGNHELKFQQVHQQRNLQKELCEKLGVMDLGYSGFFDIVFVRQPGFDSPQTSGSELRGASGQSSSFRVFYHHGAGFATTPGGKLNRLIRFMESNEADIYMIGHVHDKMARRQQPIGANASCNKLVHKNRIGVISGSYLKTYQQGSIGYGEQKGYAPVSLGAAWVRINPEARELTAEV